MVSALVGVTCAQLVANPVARQKVADLKTSPDQLLVEKYEEEYYPIPPSKPIESINFLLEQKVLTRKDLEPYLYPAPFWMLWNRVSILNLCPIVISNGLPDYKNNCLLWRTTSFGK